jgi:hypothetical protein
MRDINQRFMNVAELAQALAPCAPARSFTSVERVTQALGLPKPNLVGPMAGSMPDGRAAMPSYAGSGNTPNPYTSSQSGPRPAQFSSSNSGVHQFSPQGGTQMLGQGQQGALGSQTGSSAWGNTAGTAPPTSKAPLIAGIVLGGLVLVGGGIGGIVYATHKSAAAAPTASETATTTATTTDTSTAATTTATTTATASATTSATTTATTTTAQTAPTTTHAGTGTAATATHTHGQPTATTAQTTAATATTTKPANTAFDPLNLGRKQ